MDGMSVHLQKLVSKIMPNDLTDKTVGEQRASVAETMEEKFCAHNTKLRDLNQWAMAGIEVCFGL